MKAKPLPSYKELAEVFALSTSSPSGLIWKKPLSTKQKANSVAGCVRNNRYWYVSYKYRQLLVHRIVYSLYHKLDIGSLLVDHIDQNRLNNNPCNLRLATHQQQQCNKTAKKNSTSNYKGVSWHKPLSKWRASICVNKKRMHIGYYLTEKEAALAYNKKAEELHGPFAFLNHV